jgi:hypothetical protein
MRNKKAIFAGALMVPALALTGGAAYAGTTGSHPTPTRPAVTTTVQAHSQHPTGQPCYDRCDWRYGDHRYDTNDHGFQQHATQQPVTQRQATQHRATQHHGDRDHGGYQGNWGYQGGTSYLPGHNGDHCGDGYDW